MRKLAGLAVAAFLACVICSVARGQAIAGTQRAAPPLGAVPPTATGYNLAGAPFHPLEKGSPVVLIFMRTDCPISNRYAPTINALSQKYAAKVQFFLVYPDGSETPADIKKYMREFGFQLAPLRDPQHELVKLSKVKITPEVAVFSGKRELIYHGRIDNWYEDFGRARPQPTTHELEEAIRAAVTGSPAPVPIGGVGCYISDLK